MARKILLADDSVTAQNMGRKILADAGYEVITVNNGSAALKKITEHKPDLIVLDVYMPGYSGLEVCQRLKENHETAQVPVLLTVGKLEPFKPDEAKRVRADGFIVKPFEASELLSALSKLEDKIVPRGETAKPGRFARANAAIEEGRYDKNVAVDEDSGWRNRIAFPSKKKEKEKPPQENGDEAAFYNAMNKDLRTVVENKLAEEPHNAKAEESRVDLGALAPEGLPKDVTPEEIAALAAAAAQVKGKFAEIHPAEGLNKAEAAVEAKEPVQPFVEAPQVETPAEPEKSEITIEAAPSSDPLMESPGVPVPNPSDGMAAIAGLESASNSSNESQRETEQADEPITMAAAAGAGDGSAISRWTAVSVALAPEEAAISLEQEMQKAYAAFAASETGHAGYAFGSSEGPSAAGFAAAPEASLPVPASAAPEAAQTLTAVASAATEAVSAAVKELEAVAASYVSETVTPEKVVSAAEEPPQIEASKLDTPELSHEAHKEDQKQETKQDEAPAVAPAPVVAADSQAAAPPVVETSAPVPVPSNSPDQSSEVFPPNIEASVPEQTRAPSGSEPQAESDGTESTAAAWANWRRVRESGNNGGEAVASTPQDAAAMAVAAGAEKSPEESSATETDPESIASIVDSVLADLRPKIFEEISRKMGKKK